MDVEELEKKIKQVPPHLMPEVLDYIDFLINKYRKSTKKKKAFRFSWQGGLSEISGEYTSVALQHKAMDWR